MAFHLPSPKITWFNKGGSVARGWSQPLPREEHLTYDRVRRRNITVRALLRKKGTPFAELG